MDPDDGYNKRRRIVIDDEDEDEVISNPDELIDENINEDDEEGEDLAENWLEYVLHSHTLVTNLYFIFHLLSIPQ